MEPMHTGKRFLIYHQNAKPGEEEILDLSYARHYNYSPRALPEVSMSSIFWSLISCLYRFQKPNPE